MYQSSEAGGKILIIDDDREDYLIMRSRLRDVDPLKWEVDWASTYEMGREMLFGGRLPGGGYQAVVVDYQMGEHTGLDLIREAVERNFAAPFILITGRGNLEVDDEALRAGASLYLTKDEANSALLERTIRYAIELSQKEQALKESQASLLRSQSQLRYQAALLDYMNDAVVASDANYCIAAWNPAAERLYGWKAEEAIGKFGLDLLKTEFPEPDKEKMLTSIAETGLWRGEVTQVNRHGTRFPVEVSSIVLKDAEGKVTGYLSVNRDITGRKIVEARVAAEHEWLRTTLASIGDAVITCDAHGAVTFLNPVAEELTGWRSEEAYGKPLLTIFPIINEQTRQPADDPVGKVLESGKVVGLANHTALVNRSGKVIPIEDSAAPIRDANGQMIGVVMVFHDVTEERRLEEEKRQHLTEMEVHHRLLEYREKERQEIALDLHDGPVQDLSGLLFNIQFTKEAAKDAAVKLDLEQIALSIKQIIRDLRGTINELRPPSLIRFGVTRAIEFHAEDFLEKHPEIDLSLDLRPLGEGARLADAVHLTLFRIYQEAMNNIARHAQATEVWVSFGRVDGAAVLEIRDNGRGFPVQTGLAEYTQRDHFGLAGMRERADSVGARLDITSAEGGGTTVRVEIPLENL